MAGETSDKINSGMYSAPRKGARLKKFLIGGLLILGLVLFVGSFIGGLFFADDFKELRTTLGAKISGETPNKEEPIRVVEESEVKIVERVVEVDKEMSWYIFESKDLFGGIRFKYPDIFIVDTQYGEDGDYTLVLKANVKDDDTDRAIGTTVVAFSTKYDPLTYTPGTPKGTNPIEFPQIKVLGQMRNVEHNVLGEGSMGHMYFNNNYTVKVSNEFYIRVDSSTSSAEPYCIEETTDCTDEKYKYETPKVYMDYARKVLESVEKI